MVYNKIYAQIGEERHITLDPINYQYDVKQILVLTGETVPDYYEADVCNVGDTATLTMVGTAADGVEIPDTFLQDGRNVLVYVVIPGSGGDVQTRYDITIPVDERGEREDIDPSEAEQQQIDSLTAALNSGVGRAEAAATAAAESATDAEGSAGDAADYAEDAEAWAVGQRDGVDVDTLDPTYHNNAKYYAGIAEAAAEEAGQHEASWETWVTRAEAAADDAEGSATAAGQSKTEAEAAAQTATRQATAAGNSATAAANSASEAAQTVAGGVGAINTARDGALTAIGQAGTTQVNAVNQAGASQVTAVNQAGTTQVQAVEDKGDEVIGSIPQDYSDLVDDVADLTRQLSDETTGLDTKAPVILETASGAIASFSDGADGMPIKSLVAQIEPVQDLHGYDHPWPAGGGKNILNTVLTSGTPSNTVYSNATKRTFTVGTYIDGLTSNNYFAKRATAVSIAENRVAFTTNASAYGISIPLVGLTPGSQYTVSASITNGRIGLSFYAEDGTWISGDTATATINYYTATVPTNAYYTLVIFCGSTEGVESIFTDIQLELGSSATSFAPYSNECPISGWTGAEIEQRGKNLFDPANAKVTSNNIRYDQTSILLKGGVTYTMCSTIPVDGQYVSSIDGSYSISAYNNQTLKITPPKDVECTFNSYWSDPKVPSGGLSVDILSLKVGETTDTTYHPYTGDQLSVTFPSSAGTVYGGTLTLNPDRTGTLVVDHYAINLGALTWSNYQAENHRFGANITSLPETSNAWIDGQDICTIYRIVGTGPSNLQNGEIKRYNSGAYRFIYICDYNFSDASEIAEGLAGQLYVGKLVAPITIPLTASEVSGILTTLLGTNNIWADTGDVEVTYPADTKLYIDSLTAPDEDMIADANIASGQYFTVNNKLYLSTAAIAAGASIIPGTNCTETNLAEALNALNS